MNEAMQQVIQIFLLCLILFAPTHFVALKEEVGKDVGKQQSQQYGYIYYSMKFEISVWYLSIYI